MLSATDGLEEKKTVLVDDFSLFMRVDRMKIKNIIQLASFLLTRP